MLTSKKCICLVTGASQNLGSDIAKTIAQEIAPGSTLLLSSRSTERLQKVRKEIQEKIGNKKLHIELLQWDSRYPNAPQYESDLKHALKEAPTSIDQYEVALIVHNAAALGDLSKKVIDFKDPKELQEQLNINLVSLLVLNSVWLELVQHVSKKFVVNMSAGSSKNAVPSLGLTTMVKSSRQMTLMVLAKESLDVNVLNFDPGAVDTDALRAIRDKAHSKDTRVWIEGFYGRGEVLTADHVTKALLKTLNEGNYESGSYVNAYEVKV
jgi:sepiapterin reductase